MLNALKIDKKTIVMISLVGIAYFAIGYFVRFA
jgi:hypothetical protein